MGQSYLSNRKQFVSIGESNSLCKDVSCRAMLFLFYITDLFRALASMQTVHFANDSALYRKFKTLRDISDEV